MPGQQANSERADSEPYSNVLRKFRASTREWSGDGPGLPLAPQGLRDKHALFRRLKVRKDNCLPPRDRRRLFQRLKVRKENFVTKIVAATSWLRPPPSSSPSASESDQVTPDRHLNQEAGYKECAVGASPTPIDSIEVDDPIPSIEVDDWEIKIEESSPAPLATIKAEDRQIKIESCSPAPASLANIKAEERQVKLEACSPAPPHIIEVGDMTIKTERSNFGSSPAGSSLGGPPSLIAVFDEAGQITGYTDLATYQRRLLNPVVGSQVSPVQPEPSTPVPMARKRKSEDDGKATRSSKRGKTTPPDEEFFRHLRGPLTTPKVLSTIPHPALEKRKRSEEEGDGAPETPTTKRPRRKERAESPAYSPSTTSEDEEVNVSKRETENLLYILTREKALRLTEAFKVPDMFDMGGEEKNLYLGLALRGCKPVLAEHWQKDFTTLPKSLFACEQNESPEGARSPLLKALGRSDFAAIRAFKDLLNVGATVRDCRHLVTEPQMATRKAIGRYLRWAITDGGLHSSPETIPVHAIQVQRPGQTTLECLTQLTAKLESSAKRFHEVLAKSTDPWWPTLVGFALCGSVMTLVSLDTDVGSSAWSGANESPVKIIGHFDLAEGDEDVWNALTIAIAIVHIRDTKARLASVGAGSHFPHFRREGEKCDDEDA